ncbi:MAG: TIGR01440 family protein [Eubacteriales bacterium]|nr:TIGR01440 family protein [Eubacteriales bacterium]
MKRYIELLQTCLEQLKNTYVFQENDVLVIGCSTSEVLGKTIGKGSSVELGEAFCKTILEFCDTNSIHVAFQCCEHLNRCLVVEKEYAKLAKLKMVNVIPDLHAGGAMAVAAYSQLNDAVMVESICANVGIDIGDTIIGMHLQQVAVPVRPNIPNRKIGEANVVMAYTRLPYIGGPRAKYRG